MNRKTVSQALSDSLIKKFDNDVIMAQCAVKNIGAITSRDAKLIHEALAAQIASLGLTTVKIIKVEFPESQVNTDELGSQLGFNNFRDNDFLFQLLDLANKPQELIGDHQEDVDVTFTDGVVQTESNEDVKSQQKYELIENVLRQFKRIYREEDDNKWKQQVQNMPLLISSHTEQQQSTQVLNVMLIFRKQDLEKLNNLSFKVGSSAPLYLSFTNAIVNKDEPMIQDYADKLGKLNIQITKFQIGLFQQKDSKTVEPIMYQYQYYFDTGLLDYKFTHENQKEMQVEMFYHSDNSILQRKVELIINMFNKVLLKLEIDLAYCNYVIIENTSKEQIYYFKMLTPPTYWISLVENRKYEQQSLKTDWMRIDNVLLNVLMMKPQLISDLDRLILINNGVIRIVIDSKSNQQNFMLQGLNEKLMEFKLLYNQSPKIEIINNTPQKFEESRGLLESLNSTFSIRYNVLAAVSGNKLNNLVYIKKLLNYIIKERSEHNNEKEFEQIQEQTFQQFMKMADNLNFATELNKQNERNLKIFARELKKSKEEILFVEESDKRLAFIRRIAFTPSGLLYSHKLPEESSAMLRQFYDKLDHFIRLHFEDENQAHINQQPYICQMYYLNHMTQTDGIVILDHKFELLTWSASQLRSSQCWIVNYHGANISRQSLIDSIGDFSTLKVSQVAKNAARLGQNLSSSYSYDFKCRINVQILDDVMDQNGKMYTDGIGMISQNLIDKIRVWLGKKTISAVQIRYHGAKGVLALKCELPNNTIQLRKSMIKFNPKDGEYGSQIEILDYNKYRGGYLNRQIIILLKTLKIPDQPFIQIQQEYLHKIENIQFIDSSIYKYFNIEYASEFQGIDSIISVLKAMMNGGQNQSNNFFIEGVLNRLRMRGLLQLRTKCNILVEKAARVLGVVDEYGILDENEVYCIVSIDGESRESLMTQCGNVMITRNPCLHPGDIRKLKLATDQEVKQRNNGVNPYDQLINCVVFPQKGKSITCQTAGGDLDGDIYYIAWDDRLIPSQVCDPMEYDEEKKVIDPSMNHQQYANTCESYFPQPQMLQFMFTYISSDVLGKIDNSHLAFADQSPQFAKDDKCIALAKLHSQAVDYVKHGQSVRAPIYLMAKQWPDYMEKGDKQRQYPSPTVLGILYRDVLDKFKQFNDSTPISEKGYECTELKHIQPRYIHGYKALEEQLNNSSSLIQSLDDNSNVSNSVVEDQSNQDCNQGQMEISEYQDDYLINDLSDLLNEQISMISMSDRQIIGNFIQTRMSPHFQCVIKCISHIFDTFDGLTNLYDIKNEYEIYSGNYTNFTKGDGISKKSKINVENVQKRVIQALVVLKYEVHNIMKCEEKDEYLDRISLLHFILCYSPKSHSYKIQNKIGQFIYLLVKQLENLYEFDRLKKKYLIWYRGCSWFYFVKELLIIADCNKVNQPTGINRTQLQEEDNEQI